jgi:DNA repair protein RadA/Sms
MAVVLVGHVTKDGSIAGPRLLEHLVDVVLQFEGDKHSSLRLVRSLKNRYGPSDEVGCFEMDDTGITGVADPSGLFVSATPLRPVAGCALTVVMEGRRPLMAEVQALLAPSAAGAQRRTTSGLDPSRVSLLLAVLEGRTSRQDGPGSYSADVYTSTVGGMRITEPAADLAVALALASAASGMPVKRGTVALGEVGLAGDVRRVPGLSRRLAEAARLGFTTAIVPAGTGPLPDQVTSALHVMPVPDLAGALALGIPERAGR